jgi:hypothetical protein
MKRKLINPLEGMINLGKSIENYIKKPHKSLKWLTALALPFVLTQAARAVEGGIYTHLSIEGMGGSYFGMGHEEGGTPYLDKFDGVFKPIPYPGGYYIKSTTFVGGTELDVESESSYGEPVGASPEHSIVIPSGSSITVGSQGANFTINTYYLSGYNGYIVLCDGVPASTYTETGTVPAGTYSGPTQIDLGATTISFERDLYDPNGDTYVKNVGPTGFTAGITVNYDGWSYGDELCNAEIYYMPVGGTEWTLAGQKTGLSQGDSFEVPITGLEQNKEYFATAYIYNSKKEKYCDIENITTGYNLLAPTLITGDTTNTTHYSTSAGGTLVDDGDPTTNQAETRFVYYTNGGQQLATSWQTTQEGSSVTVPILQLTAETLYWYCFQGRNSQETGQGQTKNFTTLQAPIEVNKPAVTTLAVRDVKKKSLISEFKINSDGSPVIDVNCEGRVVFLKKENQELVCSSDWQNAEEGQQYSVKITGLDPNTPYLCRAEARNEKGTAIGNTLEFKTLDMSACPVIIDPNFSWVVMQNFVKQNEDNNEPDVNQGDLAYIAIPKAKPGIDPNDKSFVQTKNPQSSMTSVVIEEYQDPTDPNTTIYDFYNLSTHATDPRDANDIDVITELNLHGDPSLAVASENYIRFWVNKTKSAGEPNEANKLAGILQDKPLSFQFVDLGDPNTTYPVYDVEKLENNEYGVKQLPVGNLTSDANTPGIRIKPNTPYIHGIFSTTRQFADVDKTGFVDMNDVYQVQLDQGKLISRSDVADVNETIGKPDGIVNECDGRAVQVEVWRRDPSNPINASVFGIVENFEGEGFGGLKPYWINGANGTKLWTIDDAYHQSGKFSAHSQMPGIKGTSSLELNVSLDTPGVLSFKRKIRAAYGEDFGELYLNGIRITRWTGGKDWAEESFNLAPGDYNIRFDLKNNSNDSLIGDQGFWLDDVRVIPNSHIGANAATSAPAYFDNSSFSEKQYAKVRVDGRGRMNRMNNTVIYENIARATARADAANAVGNYFASENAAQKAKYESMDNLTRQALFFKGEPIEVESA